MDTKPGTPDEDEMPEVVEGGEGPQEDAVAEGGGSGEGSKRLEVILDPEPVRSGSDADSIASAQREVRARLNAIEGLHQEGVITDEEYRQARDITVYGPAGAAAQRTAPLPAQGSPPSGGKIVITAKDWKDPDRRPPWLIPTLVGVGIVAAIAVVVSLVFLLASPSDGEKYAETVSKPLALIGDSAGVVSANLAAVSEPSDIGGLRTTVNQQLRAASRARQEISAAEVPEGAAKVHKETESGARNYSLYLQQLLKAASKSPANAPAAISRARGRVGQMKADFKAAQVANPDLNVDAILEAGLGSTSGLAEAQRKRAAQMEAERRRREELERQRDIARVRTGSSFSSPSGNIDCQLFGDVLTCSTDNDGYSVSLPSYGSAYRGGGVVGGGETVPYGGSWQYGAFRCSSAESGITCYNGTNNGFALSRDTAQVF